MEVQEILEHIQYNRGQFAREAVLAAIEKREEIIPHLLQIVEDTTTRAEELAREEEYFAHFYAFYLLAQFREKRAYPLITKLFSLPGDVSERLTEDFIADGLERVLASVSHGDAGPVREIVENRNANEWARSAAIRSIEVMVAIGEHPRHEAIEYFRSLMRGRLEREAKGEYGIWDVLVSAVDDLYPQELYSEVLEACEAGLVDPFFIRIEDVDATIEKGKEAVLAELRTKYPLITDTVAEMEWWACFQDTSTGKQKGPEEVSALEVPDTAKATAEALDGMASSATEGSFSGLRQEDSTRYRALETIVRDTPKVGRNDPCKCGSGKKYKKCCGKAAR